MNLPPKPRSTWTSPLASILGALALMVSQAPIAIAAPKADDACATLKPETRAVADEVMRAAHPYDCCDGTIAACLAQRKPAPLVRRLAQAVCRRAARGDKAKAIRAALSRRARTMMPLGPPTKIDLKSSAVAGDPKAPVTLVAYACARCPYCSKVLPAMHAAVTTGRLKGKARLYLRPFPLRSHPGAAEGAMAFMVAERLGHFWPLVLRIYAHFDDFKVERLASWAAEVGMKPADYARLLKDKSVRAALVASKREGIRNKVESTPTFFLQGRASRGSTDPSLIMDWSEEAWERATGRLCASQP